MSTDTTLPIRSILNANPAWVRADLQSLKTLKISLDGRGMLLPVLVMPDNAVIDGARRVEAAHQLGWTKVPVTVLRSWDTIVEYYQQRKKLEAEGHSPLEMHWAELVDLWNRILKPAHETRRYEQAKQLRRLRTVEKARGHVDPGIPLVPPLQYTGFIYQLSEIFDLPPNRVKTLRDIFTGLEKAQEVCPALVPIVLNEVLPIAERIGTATCSTIRSMIRTVINDPTQLAAATIAVKVSLGNAQGTPWREPIAISRRLAKVRVVPAHAEEISVLTLSRMTTLLEDAAEEAHNFLRFEVPEDTKAAILLSRRMTDATRKLNAMRRRFDVAVNQAQGERA